MVLCTYFVNGHCRFGSKCVNDHIDLKTLLKSEVEAAITGKQWLLSCFGPFKESAVLPNFIPDRSFEEVRLDFMNAVKDGTTQQHVNELITQYNDAMTKLSQVKNATPDTIQLVANIYNQSLQPDQKKSAAPATTNVFAQSNVPVTAAQPQQNPFQMGNIFGGTQPQQQQPTAMNAGSIFGGAAASNPFQAATQTSIFGSKEQQAPAASSFTFSLGQQAPQQSVFGAAQPPPQNSIFGSSQATQQQPMPQSSIFGSSQPIQQQQPQPGASIFGGQANTFGSMFTGPTQQQQPQPQQGVFGSSMFPQPQPAAPAAGIFGQVQQATAQSLPFQQHAAGNVFGQFQAQTAAPPVQSSGNIFAQPSVVPSQNVFGIQQPQQTQPQAIAPSASIFQIQQPIANIQQQQQQQQTFGGNPFQTQPPLIDESAYSKPEDLTPEEIQIYQADTFELGKIPLKPPPKHLCI